ncbi:MAG TPA: 2-oxoglutarate dehydrogenase E1 [Clostridia bacterium]|nr:2-oxoglutarate dehydrogenase E1 [Clostridia bacterium]
MKAITIWQPWASLWACQAKLFETRSWATSYRGPIAIHASALNPFSAIKPVPDDTVAEMRKALKEIGILTPSTDFRVLPLGCVVATADLVGCWKIDSIQELSSAPWETGYWDDRMNWHDVSDQEIMFGDWTPGRYAWEITNVKMLDIPVPAKGKQGLWNWEAA